MITWYKLVIARVENVEETAREHLHRAERGGVTVEKVDTFMIRQAGLFQSAAVGIAITGHMGEEE